MTRTRALMAALAVAAIPAISPWDAGALGLPLVRITTPAPGAVINGGAIVAAEVDEDFPAELIGEVAFQYRPHGQGAWTPIVGPAPTGLAPGFSVLWNSKDVAGGDYDLRALLRPDPIRLVLPPGTVGVPGPDIDIDTGFSMTIAVKVNEPPVPLSSVQTVAFDPRLGQAIVLFDGRMSFDTDGTIARYTWEFDHDGTALDGAVVQKMFFPGEYPMSFTPTDDRGGEGVQHLVLTVGQDGASTTREKVSCGCKKMDVQTANAAPGGATWNPASSGVPASEGSNLGPYNDGAAGNQLDMRKSKFNVKCRFAVVAILQPQSNPKLCAEGQRIQVTATAGGNPLPFPAQGNPGVRSSDPRYDSGRSADDPYDPNDSTTGREAGNCALGSGRWCDDDYHGGGDSSGTGTGRKEKQPPNGYKKYIGQTQIVWMDAPGFNNVTRNDITRSGARFEAKFEAIVSGGLGTCKCTWTVLIEIDTTGKVTTNAVQNEVCTP